MLEVEHLLQVCFLEDEELYLLAQLEGKLVLLDCLAEFGEDFRKVNLIVCDNERATLEGMQDTEVKRHQILTVDDR